MAKTASHRPEGPRFSRRTTVFLLCLGLSAFLWLLRSLSQQYDEMIPIDVEFVGMPEERILINEPPTQLKMQVEAMGFDVLWHMLRPYRETLTIDLSETMLRKVTYEGTAMQYMLTSTQREKADALLSSSIKVVHLHPDTVYFNFVKRHSRSLPVKLVGELAYEDNVAPSGNPRTVPSKVTVFGPKELLAEMDYVETEEVKWTDIGESISAKVALKPLSDSRLLSMEEKEVEVQIDVIPAALKELKSTVTIPGRMAMQRWTLVNDQIEVTIKGTAEVIEKLTVEDFTFSVNTTDAKDGDRVKVKCDKRPQGLVDLRWTPEEVQLKARK